MSHKPIRLEIRGPPVPKGRPRFGSGRTYTPARTRQFEEIVAWEALARRVSFGNLPLAIECRFAPDLTIVEIEPVAAKSTLRGDLDNYAKGVLDGLEKGGVFENDRQIVRLLLDKSQ